MALINCSECDRQISDKSDACVGCGAPPDIFIRRTPTLIEITETEEPSLEEIELLNNNDQLYQEEIKKFNPGPIESDAISEPSNDSSDTNNVEIEFDKNDPDYRVFKITNSVLFVFMAFLNAGFAAAEGMRTNVFASYITFLISRYVVRYYYAKRSDLRNGSILYKIGLTLLVWIIVWILKLIVTMIILNIVL